MAEVSGMLAQQNPAALARIRGEWPLVVLLAFYLLLAVRFSFRLPAFSGPNEEMHYEYVALMRQTGALPDPSASIRADERHQPPVYYSLVALASLIFPTPPLDTELESNPYYLATNRGNLNPRIHATPRTIPVLYAGRMISALLGALGIAGIYVAARQMLSVGATVLIASLLAFQPMYLFLGATLNNDLAVTAVGAWLLAYTTYLISHNSSPRAFLLWGIFLGVAMLVKANAVFYIVLLPLACVGKWKVERRFGPTIKSGLLGLFGLFSVWAVWPVFNQMRGLDPLAISRSLPLERVLRQNPGDFIALVPHLGTLWRSFWLDWSRGEVGFAPNWFYVVWGIVLAGSLAGWLWKRSGPGLGWILPWMHLSVALLVGGTYLAVKTLMVNEVGFLVPEGRWLLPALPSLAWLVGVGWARWWSENKRQRACLMAALLPLLSTSLLVVLFLPSLYPQAQELGGVSRIPASARPVHLIYSDQVELLAVQARPMVAGQESEVVLYWRALADGETDYTVSVQLLVPAPDEWARLDWQNSYPGSGLHPIGDWKQGEIYRDGIALRPQGDVDGPTRALLCVWLLVGEESLPVTRDGELQELPVAEEIAVYAAKPPTPVAGDLLPDPVAFGGQFDLIGVSYEKSLNHLEVTLWWESQADVDRDYTIFVHLLDSDGQLVAQGDASPAAGRSPTHLWQLGDRIRDTHGLEMDVETDGTLLIGAYDPATLTRLPAVQGGQPLPDDAFRFELGGFSSTGE